MQIEKIAPENVPCSYHGAKCAQNLADAINFIDKFVENDQEGLQIICKTLSLLKNKDVAIIKFSGILGTLININQAGYVVKNDSGDFGLAS